MNEIIPSVLAKDAGELATIVTKLAEYTGPLHIDIADGEFVPNQTVGVEEIKAAFPNRILDVHLMVKNPTMAAPAWFGISGVRRIILHLEVSMTSSELIHSIRSHGKEAILAINPTTSAEILIGHMDSADGVHFMTVQPGFYGSPFAPAVIPEIRKFHSARPEIPIEVDGAINPQDIRTLAAAGASRFVVGSYIENAADVGKAIAELQSNL